MVLRPNLEAADCPRRTPSVAVSEAPSGLRRPMSAPAGYRVQAEVGPPRAGHTKCHAEDSFAKRSIILVPRREDEVPSSRAPYQGPSPVLKEKAGQRREA